MSRSPDVAYAAGDKAAFCIEGGGTHSRGALYKPGQTEPVAEGTGGMCNPSTNLSAALAAVEAIWVQVAAAGLERDQAVLCLGCAGLVPEDVRKSFLRALDGFAGAIPLSDGYAALIGSGGGKPCGMIVAGTGCAGHRLRPDGQSFQRDGWGWIGGDRGSGAWIGLRAIRHALRVRDGLEEADELDRLILPQLGASDAEIAAWFTTCEPRDIAAFAQTVFACAADGLERADRLLDAAASHLRDLFASLECAPDEPLYLSGSIAEALSDRIAVGMTPQPQVTVCKTLEGCRLVAAGAAPLEWPQPAG